MLNKAKLDDPSCLNGQVWLGKVWPSPSRTTYRLAWLGLGRNRRGPENTGINFHGLANVGPASGYRRTEVTGSTVPSRGMAIV